MKINTGLWFKKIVSVYDDELSVYAASLSFYSVLAIIPIFWVTFYVIEKLGVFERYFETVKIFLVDSLVPSHAVTVTNYIEVFIGNAGNMGKMGALYFVVASVFFYRNYQSVVNKIFKVPRHSFLHSVITYLLLAFVIPVALGVSFYLSDTIQQFVGLEQVTIGGFNILPGSIIWLMFFLLLKISPNTMVDTRIALKVSFVIAVLWHIAKWFFIQYTILNQTMNTLYGSFSAILFILLWVYISWLLLLHGLKACRVRHERVKF